MSSLAALPLVLPQTWRADRLAAAASHDAVRPSGFAALDAELPGGGWPAAGLIELLHGAPGLGELRLLAPMFAATAAPLLWMAPPFVPYAPALQRLGLAPERLIVADAERAADTAWAAEQALRAGVLAAVLWWPGEPPVAPATLRRLHLAATEGRTPLFALRCSSVRTLSSPAPLRLALEVCPTGRLVVDVFKRRGPPLNSPLMLDLVPPLRRRARRNGVAAGTASAAAGAAAARAASDVAAVETPAPA